MNEGIKKNINKGKRKNYYKRKELVGRKGAATAETILIIAVVLVVIITVFYPQLSAVITNTMNTINAWYNNSLVNIGVF